MSAHEETNWYYASTDNKRHGPVSIAELGSLSRQGVIGPKTLVWNQRYSSWVPASEVSDLLNAALAVPPDRVAGDAPGAIDDTRAMTDEIAPEMPMQELKPRKRLFIGSRILSGLALYAVIAAVVSVVLLVMEKSPWPGLAVFAAGGVLVVMASFAAFRKERYHLGGGRVTCHRGGLLSDQTTEFEIRNITHIKIKLPWLRFKFYGVGNIEVQTAGNSQPVLLRLIDEPELVFAGLRERMKRNGYDLTQRQLLHEERPAIIGVIGECLGLLVGGVFFSLFLFGVINESPEEALDPVMLIGLFATGSAVLLFIIIVRFLDLRRRMYRVFNDVVVYEEGFLTRENAFIPYENIADSNTNCSFWDRIFGLYDVNVSCQGSGSEIKFRRLAHGVALSAAIDQIVVYAGQKKKSVVRGGAGKGDSDHPPVSRRSEPEAVPIGEIRLAELRMHVGRTLLPLLFLLPLFPLWIIAMIQYGIRLASTRYSVRHGSLRHSYRFLTLHDREFACEKITGMVIKQNLWDRMFGTMTLRFWSIGSGKPLEFTHVHAGGFDLPSLMRQAGIPAASPEPYEVSAAFGFSTWLRASLIYLPIWLIFAVATVFAAIELENAQIYYLLALPFIMGVFAWIRGMMYYSRQRLVFHQHHIEAKQGIIAQRQYYARYGNIKRSESTRYPGGEEGRLEVFVAGEEEVLQGAQQHQRKGVQTALKQCSFTSGYLPAVGERAMLLDDILSGRVEAGPQVEAATGQEVLLEARRSVGNAVIKLILISVLLFPLIVLLPLTLPMVWVRVGRWRYRVEASRVVVSWGVLYPKQTSILLDRVDSLQQSQGALNKIFRNGNVSIMTAGSSKPDLRIIDSPEYLALYQLIRERSQ